MRQDHDGSNEVAALPVPVMFVVGDSDAVQLSHVVEEFGRFGGGKRDAGAMVPRARRPTSRSPT